MSDSLVNLSVQLIKNGITHRYLRTFGKVQKPQAVSLELTHRCIARCTMCNIWRIPKDTPLLSANQWLALLSRDLFSDLVELDITGGEPFLRTDLADLVIAVCRLKKRVLKALRSIAVTTNGFLTRRVLAQSRRMLHETRRAGIDLVMVCAMDAVGGMHDTIRGYPDGWRRVDQSISGLKTLQSEFPNLIIGLKTTVLPATVGHLGAIVRYARENDLFTIISPCIITKGRYLNPDRADDLAFTHEQLGALARFFQSGVSQWSFHQKRLVDYFRTGRMRKPCTCGFNYFFIRSQGTLMLCPMIGAGLGNVLQTPVEKLLASEQAIRIRRRVGRFRECRRCTEPGLERYSLPYEGWTYLAMLFKMGSKRFLQMHNHMGLDKYFT